MCVCVCVSVCVCSDRAEHRAGGGSQQIIGGPQDPQDTGETGSSRLNVIISTLLEIKGSDWLVLSV